jgi:hypothetical protein
MALHPQSTIGIGNPRTDQHVIAQHSGTQVVDFCPVRGHASSQRAYAFIKADAQRC